MIADDPGALWILIAATALLTMAMKAVGPVLLGGRDLPPTVTKVLVGVPPVVLAALVATSALADGSDLQVDARTAGVAVGGLLLWQGRHLLLAVLAAAAVSALLRAVGVP